MTGSVHPAYRPDIDGLRAIAVVPVVLFHAGVPGFGGGFVGVDVFFVISGFLLTGILLRELDAGRFSIGAFYVRRARRILPALLVVVLASLLAGFFLMTPEQYAQTGRVAQAVMTITANNFFARTRADYWNQSSLAEQPLLHTWSLAVEEQFYLVLPILLWALYRWQVRAAPADRARRTMLVLLGAIALLSLASAEWLLRGRQGDAFFLLVPRAWELLAGSLLAVVLHGRQQPGDTPLVRTLGGAGLLLIAIAAVAFDERMRFPGLAALVPCMGACLVIYSGASGGGFAHRLLSTRPLVAIGLVSYSLYLWHWPVLVHTRSLAWHAWGLPGVPLLVQLAVMLALAWLSWRFVEQPFRRPRAGRAPADAKVLGTSVVAMAAVWSVGAGALAIGAERWPLEQAIPPIVVRLAADMRATPGLRCEGSSDAAVIRANGGGCLVGSGSDPATVALLGDSHARMYTEALQVLASERGERVLVMARSSCVPILGFQPPTRQECAELTHASIDFLARSNIRRVVLAGYWIDVATDDEKAAELAAGLDDAVATLVAAGKRVDLVLDVPELPDNTFAHRAAVKSIRSGNSAVHGPSLEAHRAHQARFAQYLERVAQRHGIGLLDPAALLCDPQQGCLVAADGRAVYRDRHHLTDAGAVSVRSLFSPVLQPDELPARRGIMQPSGKSS